MMVDSTRIHMRADEFLSLPETTQITELLNGEVVVSPSATDTHQQIVGAIYVYLRVHAPRGAARIAPLDVWLDESNVVQSDVFWVSAQNEKCYRVEDKFWQGPPDLTVEVLSPSNAQNDYRMKYDLYQRHGVREYWIVHPVEQVVQVFVNKDGAFEHHGSFEAGDSFTSPVLETTVEIEALLGGQ